MNHLGILLLKAEEARNRSASFAFPTSFFPSFLITSYSSFIHSAPTRHLVPRRHREVKTLLPASEASGWTSLPSTTTQWSLCYDEGVHQAQGKDFQKRENQTEPGEKEHGKEGGKQGRIFQEMSVQRHRIFGELLGIWSSRGGGENAR